jgi:hypothetical protein
LRAYINLIDWNFDEDRSRVRTGFGPENITSLRRFAIGILKSFQKPTPVYRGNDAHPLLPHPSRLRLSAYDEKLSARNAG